MVIRKGREAKTPEAILRVAGDATALSAGPSEAIGSS
jgi:hypothetical protein